MDNNYTGNISTIVKWISMLIAGWFIGTLTANNLNLPVDTTTLSQVISAFIFLLIGYIDSKYHNTFRFLDNAPITPDNTVEEQDLLLNEEYEFGD